MTLTPASGLTLLLVRPRDQQFPTSSKIEWSCTSDAAARAAAAVPLLPRGPAREEEAAPSSSISATTVTDRCGHRQGLSLQKPNRQPLHPFSRCGPRHTVPGSSALSVSPPSSCPLTRALMELLRPSIPGKRTAGRQHEFILSVAANGFQQLVGRQVL